MKFQWQLRGVTSATSTADQGHFFGAAVMKRKLLLGAVFSTLALNAIAQPLLQCGAAQSEPAAVIRPVLVGSAAGQLPERPLFAKDGLGSSYSDSSEREARDSSQPFATPLWVG
jgi:hypothetical protein